MTEKIAHVIKQLINVSDPELENFLSMCNNKHFKRYEILSRPGFIPGEIFFINKGLIRVSITDSNCIEHSLHFGLENQFIADYAAFILQQRASYTLRAEEETEVVVLPRSAVEWGYLNLAEGNKLGRLIAEYYFIYQDKRIKDLYAKTPTERYDSITEVFPDIHNRIPQHMIASYLGVTAVHLSRLKKASQTKI